MENNEYNSLTQRLISNGILPNSDSRAFGVNFFVENSNENQEITQPNFFNLPTKPTKKRLNKSDFELMLETCSIENMESINLLKTIKRFISFKQKSAKNGSLNFFEYFLLKLFPKVYMAKLAKDAMQKLTELDIDAKLLSDKTIPYGENEKRYNDLIRYIVCANELQVKMNKKI